MTYLHGRDMTTWYVWATHTCGACRNIGGPQLHASRRAPLELLSPCSTTPRVVVAASRRKALRMAARRGMAPARAA